MSPWETTTNSRKGVITNILGNRKQQERRYYKYSWDIDDHSLLVVPTPGNSRNDISCHHTTVILFSWSSIMVTNDKKNRSANPTLQWGVDHHYNYKSTSLSLQWGVHHLCRAGTQKEVFINLQGEALRLILVYTAHRCCVAINLLCLSWLPEKLSTYQNHDQCKSGLDHNSVH